MKLNNITPSAYRSELVAHELGHALGLGHVCCFAEVSVVGQFGTFEHEGMNFVISDAKIINCIDENMPEGTTVKVLQTVIDNENIKLVEKDKNYVLFLTQYDGPIAESAYVVTGLNLGQLTINHDKVVLNENQQNNFDIIDNNVVSNKDNLIEEIKKNIK
ncbi:MAG: hypothetical protein ACK5KR_09135 [Breznakia sp.]